MTFEIIKKGRAGSWIKDKCENCKTTFRYTKDEAKAERSPHPGDAGLFSIKCPNCGKKLWRQ